MQLFKVRYDTIRYDTIGEFNVDWKAEIQLYLAHVARKRN